MAATKAKSTPKAKDSGESEVQAKFDEIHEAGYFGPNLDETPNGHYAVAGVIAGKPTPENTKES